MFNARAGFVSTCSIRGHFAQAGFQSVALGKKGVCVGLYNLALNLWHKWVILHRLAFNL